MNKGMITELKLGVTAFFAAITAWLGSLAMPMYLLVLLNIADYVTGLIAAPCRGQRRSSSVGFAGIAKKVCMWILVGVGAAIDWLIAYTATTAGIALVLGGPVAAAVAIWLICNELISILENIGDTGVHLPGFLKQLVRWVSRQAEQSATPVESATAAATDSKEGTDCSYDTKTDSAT